MEVARGYNPKRFEEDGMVKTPTGDSFDPQQFLAKVGAGKTIANYRGAVAELVGI